MPRWRAPSSAVRRPPSSTPLAGLSPQQTDLLLERLQLAQHEVARMLTTLDELARVLRGGHGPVPSGVGRPAGPGGELATAPSIRPAGTPRGGWDSR